jgi:prophage regulatory protein
MANFESSQRHPTGEVKMSNVSEQKAHPLCILRMTELTAILGISRSSIYEKLNPKSRYYDAEFPKPVRLGLHLLAGELLLLTSGSLPEPFNFFEKNKG